MKKNKNSHQKIHLDPEEKEILSSFENDEWRTVNNVEKEKENVRTMASKTLSMKFHFGLAIPLIASVCSFLSFPINAGSQNMEVQYLDNECSAHEVEVRELPSAEPLPQLQLYEDLPTEILNRVESYIINETAYRDKDPILSLARELRQNHTYQEKGSDDLRVKFVALQEAMEHVLSSAFSIGEIVDLRGYIHTPMPATPLCMRPDDVPIGGLIDTSLSQDFDKELSVQSRSKIVREYLLKGGQLTVLYPREGLNKRSLKQRTIYFEALSQFPHLIDWVLDCDSLEVDKIGATYLFTDRQGVTYSFAIKSYQANDIQPNTEWGVWFGPINDPCIRQRINEISDYLETVNGPSLFTAS